MNVAQPSILSCQVVCIAHTVALTVLALLKSTGAVQTPACSFPAMLPFLLQVCCARRSSLEGPTLSEAVALLEEAAWGAWAAGGAEDLLGSMFGGEWLLKAVH